jgi:hypothetical protein
LISYDLSKKYSWLPSASKLPECLLSFKLETLKLLIQ